MNRRAFGYVTAFAGALSNAAWARREPDQSGRVPDAAGLITEIVFLDDCTRVAMYDPALSGAAKTALTAHPDFVRNGALSPAGLDIQNGEKYALGAGRLWSETLNRHRQPNTAEARLYQDIAILRDMAVKTGCDPAKPSPIADLLDLIEVRRRLDMHTLNPGEDIQKWLEGIIAWRRDERALLSALAAAYTSPAPAKLHEFVSEFYNPADPLIRLARGFQFGEVPPADGLAAALKQAPQGSRYARALAEAAMVLKKAPNTA